MSDFRKAGSDPKKSARKSRRLTVIDLLVVIVVVIGLMLFYQFSVDRAIKIQDEVNKTEANTAQLGLVTFFDDENRQNVKIIVEVAQTNYEQTKGLMFREDIPENQGMLFIYPDEDIRHFWMKNTSVSLDIIFVNAAYKIITIQKETVPYSERLYPSTAPAQFVVEVRSGFTDRYAIREGQRISWELL